MTLPGTYLLGPGGYGSDLFIHVFLFLNRSWLIMINPGPAIMQRIPIHLTYRI